MTKCDRYFIDNCGQGFTAPCCKNVDDKGNVYSDSYDTFVECKGWLENCPKNYKPKETNKIMEYESKKYINSKETEERFKAEYEYVKRKYNNLHRMIVQYEAGTLDFTPNCSLELLKRQAKAMGEYLYVLELRAEIEGIELE